MAIGILLCGLVGIGYSQRSVPAASKDQPQLTLPLKGGSLKFVAIGDTGSGTAEQRQVSETMLRYRQAFPFDFVLMMGDNLYGGEKPDDYRKKFETIYRELLDAKVKFYASLGNHDNSTQRFYDHFNMNGKEYYTLRKGDVTFYALNSNYMDENQVKWLDDELSKDKSKWKIAFFHHPPYSSGKQHGSNESLREVIEPIFLKHGVNLVLTGHEHFYERIKPQKGIYYFISGAGGKLRPGGIKTTNLTEKSFDQDLHFMLIEIDDDELYYQVISRSGKTVDSGMLLHQRKKNERASGIAK
jgi:predicted MPP superfamily phosphohydrolase